MKRYEEWAERVSEQIREKMSWSSRKNRNKLPYTTDVNGEHIDRAQNEDCNGLSWWTNGFWGGIMWLLYQDTGDVIYKEIARSAEKRMDKCFEFFCGLLFYRERLQIKRNRYIYVVMKGSFSI